VKVFDRSTVAAELADIMGDAGGSLTFNGRTYACSRVSLRAEDLRAMKTEATADYAMTVSVVASAFGALPAPAVGDVLVWDSAEYRVLATEADSLGIQLRLHLGVRYQGGGR